MEIDNSLCKECGICLEICPQKAITKSEGLKIIPEKCNLCRQCELLCPEGAICFKNEETEKTKNETISEKRGGWINSKPLLKTGQKYFLSGNDACTEGALAAGCRFFAGYPITPASEILERMALRMPELSGSFIQMEDEIASMAAIIGASWTGVKSMTATSGPGFSLMQEGISFADMTETPCVVIDVQRGGPSTGMPTKPSTGDIRMARWGDHGGLQHIAICPASAQECYELTIKAFNLSEKYRTPVIILTDAFLAHLTETLIIKPQKVFNRIYIPGEPPFGPTKNCSAPSMPNFNDQERLMITGSAHDQWGSRNTSDSEPYEKLIHHLENKIIKKRPIDVEKFLLEDAEEIIVAYGLVGRIAKETVKEARKKGKKIGLLRLKILWPFPTEIIKKYEKQCKKFIVPEMNQGQLFFVVQEKVSVKLVSLSQQDGEPINPQRIYKYIMKGIWQ